jgi:hypothetical protein
MEPACETAGWQHSLTVELITHPIKTASFGGNCRHGGPFGQAKWLQEP